jgi:hypothetical protein
VWERRRLCLGDAGLVLLYNHAYHGIHAERYSNNGKNGDMSM